MMRNLKIRLSAVLGPWMGMSLWTNVKMLVLQQSVKRSLAKRLTAMNHRKLNYRHPTKMALSLNQPLLPLQRMTLPTAATNSKM